MTRYLTLDDLATPAVSSPGAPVVLQAQGVAVSLGGREVLRDVCLHAQTGELVGLIGPNGAGKTTMLRAILRLVPLQAGTITVTPRTTVGSQHAARIGYVPQRHDFAWDYPLSVLDAVVSARTPYRSWWKRPDRQDYVSAATALDRVGLYELRQRPVGELSGGQRQRVLIARALAVEPSVLLLDEPMTGLDIPSQDSLHTLFTDLAREGESLVMTTHDIPSALTLCHRLYLLRGTVIGAGAPCNLADPALWRRTFDVEPDSSLLRVVAACVAPDYPSGTPLKGPHAC